MIARFYRVVAAGDVEAEKASATCQTTRPRHSIDGSKAILRHGSRVEGSITHAEAIALVAGADWTAPDQAAP